MIRVFGFGEQLSNTSEQEIIKPIRSKIIPDCFGYIV
jgi:hypothetical protein